MSARTSLSKKVRFTVLARDSFTCCYCGAQAPMVRLHVDHVVPVAAGGTNAYANLVTACEWCNAGKAAIPPGSSVLDHLRRLSDFRKLGELAGAERSLGVGGYCGSGWWANPRCPRCLGEGLYRAHLHLRECECLHGEPYVPAGVK